MSVYSAKTSSCSASGACARRLRCLCTVQRRGGTLGHSAAKACSSPAPAINNEELGRAQAAGDQVVEDAAPLGFAFPSHLAHGQEQLLPIAAHAEGNQQPDIRRL